MRIIIHWLVTAIAILAGAYLLPGIALDGFLAAIIVAVVLGVLNAFIKPILVALTLPINILTLGLFTLVINALLIMLAGAIVPGFGVAGFVTALLFGIIIAVVVYLIDMLIPERIY